MRVLAPLALVAACTPTTPPTGGTTVTFDGPFERVDVAASSGRIEFVAGEIGGVEVEFLPSGSDTWTSTEDGTMLVLVATCLGDEVVGCGGGFVVTVPFDQDVTADTDSGQVALGAGLAGALEASTASGPIDATDLGAAALTTLTGTGAVTVGFGDTPTSVSIDTGSSNVELTVPGGSYALDVDTNGTSNVDGLVDDPMGIPLRVHSGTGNIGIVGT